MPSSLPRLVNNLSEGINKINCKYGHDDKKLDLNKKNLNNKYKVCHYFPE